eukprot:gene449-14524_t
MVGWFPVHAEGGAGNETGDAADAAPPAAEAADGKEGAAGAPGGVAAPERKPPPDTMVELGEELGLPEVCCDLLREEGYEVADLAIAKFDDLRSIGVKGAFARRILRRLAPEGA